LVNNLRTLVAQEIINYMNLNTELKQLKKKGLKGEALHVEFDRLIEEINKSYLRLYPSFELVKDTYEPVLNLMDSQSELMRKVRSVEVARRIQDILECPEIAQEIY